MLYGKIFEEFCKPQFNEVIARFNLLTSLGKEKEVWMNGTMQDKCKLH